MHPILGTLHTPWGSLPIYSYGVLVATGVLAGLWYARHHAPRAGIDPDRVWNLGIYMVLSALVGAKIWFLLSAGSYYWLHPGEIFSAAAWQAGGTFYGGLFAAMLVIVLYTRFEHLAFLPLADCYGLGLPLGHAIGRLGCFAAGCCYGKPTWLPWGVTFTSPVARQLVGTPLGVPLHPTQLYGSAAEFLNFLVLIGMARKQKFAGEIFATYMLLYGVERGMIEFVRGDPGRTLLFHGRFSLMQFVSLGLVIAGAWLWRRGMRRTAPERGSAVMTARH